MSQPGQFFYDRASRSVVYWPLSGQDPNAVECVVPTTTDIFYINGRQYSRPWGITLSNLTLSVATAPLVTEGDYAAYLFCGAVQTKFCDNITLDGLNIGPVAGHAFWSRGAVNGANEFIRNCDVGFCGAGGIQSGSVGAVISNNFIHSIGLIYPSAPGIVLASSSTAIHNDIFDCKMIGIEGSYVNNSYILNNHLSNCVQVLRDMGAIYTWTSTNNVIAYNLIEHVVGRANNGRSALDWFRHAIYCDDYTSGYIISGNVTRDCPSPLMIHDCDSHVITNNFFIDTSDIVELRFRSERTNNIIFQRNICYSTTNLYAEHYQNGVNVDNWSAVVDWHSNIFYSVIGQATGNTNTVGAETRVAGIPTNAVALDPKFTGLSSFNFSFQPDSPAPGLGILPLNVSQMGRVTALVLPASDLHVLPPGP
jgi:hypothetical protein